MIQSFFKRLKNVINPTPRLIVYGDIHGCLKELQALRKKIDPLKRDIEVSVGDFITKGEDSIGVIDYMIENNIYAVLGNHEEKLLRYLKHFRLDEKNMIKLNDDEKKILKQMRKKHLHYLEKLPVFLKFGDITIVHGGLENGMKLHKLSSKMIQKILRLRYVDENGHFITKIGKAKKRRFWADVYDGSEGFVIHGHRWSKTVHIHEHAIGIDTGCVYGHKLTALVLSSKYDYRIVQQESFKKKSDILEK
ncbi:serine/threonine protein phosphatase [hydrothermal vent metagenome]|uniref:Serine/threonine protein phosphatase n=1 Tax=hydrothermal vent metagenome TaxID=652676 RepID=A0A1W1D542_9ZZZZ